MQWSPFYFVFLYIKPLKVIFSELGHLLFFIFPVKGRYKVELDKITKLLTEFCIFQLLLQSIGTYVFMYVCIYISIYAASPWKLNQKTWGWPWQTEVSFYSHPCISSYSPIFSFSYHIISRTLSACFTGGHHMHPPYSYIQWYSQILKCMWWSEPSIQSRIRDAPGKVLLTPNCLKVTGLRVGGEEDIIWKVKDQNWVLLRLHIFSI